MKFVIDENGSREKSEDLFKYLMNYQYGLSDKLRNQNCHIMAEVIENQTSALRSQYFKLLQEGKFISGWK